MLKLLFPQESFKTFLFLIIHPPEILILMASSHRGQCREVAGLVHSGEVSGG